MKRSILILLAILAFGAPLAAQTATTAAPTTLDTEVASAELIRRSSVSLKQFKSDIARLEKLTGKTMSQDERKQYLDLMVNDLLFLQYCDSDYEVGAKGQKKAKITVTDVEVNQTLQQMKVQVMQSLQKNPQGVDSAILAGFATSGTVSDDDFFGILARLGVQAADLKMYVKKRLLLNKYMASKQDLVKTVVQPSYDEVNTFYKANLNSFLRPETVKLGILFVETRGMDDATKKKAKATVDALYAKVKGNAAAFSEAILRSLEPDSGYTGEPEFYYVKTPEYQKLFGEQFYNVAIGLKKDGFSGIIDGPNGYHILHAIEVYPPKQLDLTDSLTFTDKGSVFDYIKQNLYSQKVDKFMEDTLNTLVKNLRSAAKVKIKTELLAW
jgi:hypothetical protein